MAITISNVDVKDTLNPKVWDGWSMRPVVRYRLLLIAEDFLSYLGDPAYEDIRLTGSMANFNWTSKSDIDLHPIIDFSKVDDNTELVRELFMAKKSLWNNEHDIEIYGFDVECYAQDVSDPHYAGGMFSILKNEWIKRPTRERVTIDANAVRSKANDLETLVNKAVKDSDTEHLDLLKKKLKKLRQSGLERGGEFSVENLAYKALRNAGVLDKLWDAATKKKDSELSLK